MDPDQIPNFEGRQVEAVLTKIKGADTDDLDLIVAHDDLVQVTALYKVVGVNHDIDKDGNLRRVQTLVLQEAVPQPFANDPSGDGVQRLMGPRGSASVSTSTAAPVIGGSIDDTVAALDA